MIQVPDEDPEQAKLFGSELMRVANRQLRRIYTDKTVKLDRLDFPTLAFIFEEIHHGAWPDEPNESLRDMVFEALKTLPDAELADNCSISWRDMGLTLFGFQDDSPMKPNGQPHDYDSRSALIKQAGTASIRTTRRSVAAMYQKVADALLKRAEQAQQLASRTEPTSAQPPSRPYVRRDALHDQLSQAIADGHHAVALVGEGGVGKSTLARNYALEAANRNEAEVIEVYAASRETIAETLADELDRIGIHVPGAELNYLALMRQLRSLADIDYPKPLYILFDNIEDWRLAEKVKPSPEVVMLYTARTDPSAELTIEPIAVGELNAQERTEVARTYFPEVSDEDAKKLSRILGGRALAIEHVCVFLANYPEIKRMQFVASLEQDVVPKLDQLAGRLGKTGLHSVYRSILDSLIASPETVHAVDLLELIAFSVDDHSIKEEFLRFLYGCLLDGSDPRSHLSDLPFESGCTVLQRYHLIEIETAMSSRYAQPEFEERTIKSHQLTRDLVRYLRANRLDFWKSKINPVAIVDFEDEDTFTQMYIMSFALGGDEFSTEQAREDRMLLWQGLSGSVTQRYIDRNSTKG